MNRKKTWLICCLFVLGLIALTYSPVVLSPGKMEPSVGAIPYTLAWGFGISLIMVAMTIIGARVHPVNEEEDV